MDEDKDCLVCPYYSKCMSNDSEKHKAMVDAADVRPVPDGGIGERTRTAI